MPRIPATPTDRRWSPTNLTIAKAGNLCRSGTASGSRQIRSPIDWRMDGGAWTRIELRRADRRCGGFTGLECRWAGSTMGSLDAGDRRRARILRNSGRRRVKDAKGARADLHYASDAIVLDRCPVPSQRLRSSPIKSDGDDGRGPRRGTQRILSRSLRLNANGTHRPTTDAEWRLADHR